MNYELLQTLNEFVRYASSSSYYVSDLSNLLTKVGEDLNKKKEEEVKSKFKKIVEITENEKKWDIFITKNSKGLYDICLITSCYYMPSLSSYDTDELLSTCIERKYGGFVVDDIDRENISKFLKALYLYNNLRLSPATNGEAKDLMQFTHKKFYFDDVERPTAIYVNDSNRVHSPKDFHTELFRELSLKDINPVNNFEEALNIIYENKLIGTKLSLIKS